MVNMVSKQMIEMIRQENKRIEPCLDFDVEDFKRIGGKFVLFYFDKDKSRNRYEILSIKKLSEEYRAVLNMSEYRGNITVEGFGLMPLFVNGFNFPLYSVDIKYKVVDIESCSTRYISVNSPISFKLKDKEDRLCFDAVVKTYNDITLMVNDNYTTKVVKKAFKVEIPNI